MARMHTQREMYAEERVSVNERNGKREIVGYLRRCKWGIRRKTKFCQCAGAWVLKEEVSLPSGWPVVYIQVVEVAGHTRSCTLSLYKSVSA